MTYMIDEARDVAEGSDRALQHTVFEKQRDARSHICTGQQFPGS